MSKKCHHYKLLIMKHLDGETSPSEAQELTVHLAECANCQQELEDLQKIKEVTGEMKKHFLPEMAWDEYWRRLFNRLERGISWILISIGAIILLVYGAYHFVIDVLGSSEIPGIVRVGILTLVIGLAILLVSVIREKLMVRKHDKYKEVKR